MTDARLPERYLSDRRLLRLPSRAFRTYAMTLLWSVSNRTDGHLEAEEMCLVPHWDPQDASTLEDAGLWQPEGRGWRIVDFASTQTSSHELAVLENTRRREREKKARQRARSAEESRAGTVPGDKAEGLSPGTAQEGQARQDRQAGTTSDTTWPGLPSKCACGSLVGQEREVAGHKTCGACDVAAMQPAGSTW